MWETICAIIGLCMALYGVLEAVGRLSCRLVFGKADEELVVTVGPWDGEYRIRQIAAHCRYRLLGGVSPTVVLAQDNEHLLRLCKQLGLTVYTVDEWHKRMKNRFTTVWECDIIQK